MKNSNILKITHIDYSILALVRQTPMSGYGIRMVFQKTALGNYSGSPGTIYPALKRLEKIGVIEKKKHSNPKKQFLFAITKTGIEVLKKWLMRPISAQDVTKNLTIIILRFAFMDGSLTQRQKRNFLVSFRIAVKNYIVALEEYYVKESKRMPLSGRQAFEYGIESYKTTLKWIQKTISS